MAGRIKLGNTERGVEKLREALDRADAVLVGAGAGLSTAAGFIYIGARFQKYFADFVDKYHFEDMYSGGFYPYQTLEEFWGFWSRYIYVNRYMNPPKPVYENLFNQVKDKDYFVITTNVDHCFQKAGFDKHKLFYTQGDYGLFQCSEPCCRETFDNEEMVRAMLEAQGFSFAPDGSLVASENRVGMKIPSNLVPKCPHCGKPLTTNLRADGTFVEDEGWRTANMRYEEFVRRHEGLNVLYLELGVGFNTPIIIKYPFWSAAGKNAKATYACLNAGEACAPEALMDRAILINGDIAQVLEQL